MLLDPVRRSLLTRRTLLARGACGLGALAAGSLLAHADEPARGAIPVLHHPAKAKRVIFLVMSGGPSQLELFDHKPMLAEHAGKPLPDSIVKGQQVAQGKLNAGALACQFPFQQHGKSGQSISDILPNIAGIADDICIVRSMQTTAINHDPAQTVMNTGSTLSGRPAWGSWTWYGLGNPAQDLPGFVVLISAKGGQQQPVSNRQWHSGFLPSRFQGVHLRHSGDPVSYLRPPDGIDAGRQRDTIDAIAALDHANPSALNDPSVDERLAQYEMAFRMQSSVPELAAVDQEPEEVRKLYGLERDTGGFARCCLIARRLAERGVPFIQVYHRDWDHHGGVKNGVKETAGACDQASAALIIDLKRRGLLDDTIVVWGGEFGRTPFAQGDGRDHHMKGYTMWLAGGGIRGGTSYGATDDFGYHAVTDVVSIHDLHATILHQMGVDHRRLTVRHQGRDHRLTDVHGQIVRGIIA